MTDNKTIKALGCCINKYNNCENCPLFLCGDSKACQNKLQADVLDLINRQKAEIERLQTAVNVKNKFIQGMDKAVERAYKKAIKEFAERLRKHVVHHLNDLDDDGDPTPWIDPFHVDNLVKEMAGEG